MIHFSLPWLQPSPETMVPTPLISMIHNFFHLSPVPQWTIGEPGFRSLVPPVTLYLAPFSEINLYFLCCKILLVLYWALMHTGTWTTLVW